MATKRTCKRCGAVFYKCSQGHHGDPVFCSNACSAASKRSRVEYHCKYCGKAFERKASYGRRILATGIYCSKTCRDQSQESKVSLACKQCGKIFAVIKGRASTAAFCSRKCKVHYRGETWIEREIRLALDFFRLDYEQEYPISKGTGRGSAYSVDFFIPAEGLAIEADGAYWHSNRVEHDSNRDAFLLTKGIRTLRITDTELRRETAKSIIFRELYLPYGFDSNWSPSPPGLIECN